MFLDTDEKTIATEWAELEELWVSQERPFYNLWPIAIELAQTVSLDVQFSQINPHHKNASRVSESESSKESPLIILLRFPESHDYCKLCTVFVCWKPDKIVLLCRFSEEGLSTHSFGHRGDQKVEEFLSYARDIVNCCG
jgi:hypothetical protein